MSRRLLYLCCIILLTGVLAPHAHASADRVSFLHDIIVGESEEADDLVCFFCSIRADGKVNGDAVSFFGGVRMSGEISGDVVSFFGPVKMEGQSSIGGDCVVFGAPLRRSDDASIGGDTVQFSLLLFLLPFLILALIIYGGVSLARRRKYAAYPMPPPPPAR
jgi:hypothetical protein